MQEQDDDELQSTVEKLVQRDYQLDEVVDERLSDLDDDDDVKHAFVPRDEIDFRRVLWDLENCDWVERERDDVVAKDKERIGKKKRRVEGVVKLEDSKPALSRKLNYNVMQELLYE